jgi:hypothetical protein
MTRFYQPDLALNFDDPFIRDNHDKLIRRSYWLDMDDRSLVMVMVNGIGAHLTNEQKRAHLIDIRREHLGEFLNFSFNLSELLPQLAAAICLAVRNSVKTCRLKHDDAVSLLLSCSQTTPAFRLDQTSTPFAHLTGKFRIVAQSATA